MQLSLQVLPWECPAFLWAASGAIPSPQLGPEGWAWALSRPQPSLFWCLPCLCFAMQESPLAILIFSWGPVASLRVQCLLLAVSGVYLLQLDLEGSAKAVSCPQPRPQKLVPVPSLPMLGHARESCGQPNLQLGPSSVPSSLYAFFWRGGGAPV